MLGLEFSGSSKKFLSKCEDGLYRRLLLKMNELCENPFPSDCKRVLNRKEKCFRVRVGKYRVIYVVDDERNVLFITDVDKRESLLMIA